MKVTPDGPVEPVNDFQAVDPRIPMTPGNGNFFNPNLICQEQMLDPVSWFGSYEPGIGANPEFLESNAAISCQFQADPLQNPSFQNLLELVTVGSNGYIGRATSSNATVDFQSGLNYLSSGQVYNYGSSSPYGMPYDFNLLPSGSISTQFAPIPPEQATWAYTEQSFNARNITENSYRNGELKTNADSQLVVEQSSTTLPVNLLEDHAPDKGGGEVGELLKIPQQKSRRKKHRPKVVIEGKKPRTQKPAPEGSTKRKYVRRDNTDPITTPPGSEEKSAGKRKYGKEQEVGNTNSTPLDDGTSINNDIISLRTRSSCRKSLNFESENPQINDSSDLSSMGKCRIVFSDASHDKEVNAVQVMMGSDVRCVRSNCSSSTCLTQETEAEICSPNSNGVKYNSMRSYASTLFPNSTDVSSMSFPVIVKKKRTTKWNKAETSKVKSLSAVIENCETQKAYFVNSRYSVFDYTTVNGKQVSSSSLELVDYRNAKRKRSKGPTRPRSSPLGSCEQLLNYRRESSVLSQLPANVKTKKRSKRNSTTSTAPLAITWKPMSLMDEVIERLIHLDIDNQRTRAMMYHNQNPNLQMSYREQNALVVYQRDGTIVPVRKRKPRPKVDLDEETTRVWRLLLEDIRNEGIDGTDEEKARWWEEERRVFRGRADSFIARMHLVQGDRRFTPWKGSVVDSVVGVFLTQNVSDHLSSSAFMSLAARYPPKSSIIPEESLGEETTMINRDPEVHVLEPDDIVTCHIAGVDETTTEVDIESTQNSVDSSIAQSEKSEINSVCTTEEVTAESEGKFFTSSTSFVELIHTVAGNPELQEVLHSNREPDLSEKKDWCCTTETMIITTQFEEVPKSSSEDENLGSIVDPELIVESQIHERTSEVRERNMVAKNLPDLNEKPAQSSFNVDSEQIDSIVDSGNAKAAKEKGRRPGKQKPEAVDWDALRKEAHKDSIKRERSANTMDSLDWERIRCADVDEIADTIKSRGMNNMLAERIKAFLDRIVQDHGSTDLEWLRDVLPDKTKEYLLSIRGLGLKSVECVRLLTLHHLAFPVDVNVGRIAVRLGWVPLQPLPESLQLHLLELYPVLESIQKYLWPRLCKLDQRTLYELHYQMITFGKVFCTKSKPNCNACPMRGECRHFASAFASARLTLPAPAEKGIVATTVEHVADPHSTGIHSREKLCLPYANRQLGEDVQSSVPSGSNNSTDLGLTQFTKHFGANSESSSSSHTAHVPVTTEPNVEEPPSPESEHDEFVEPDMEDFEDPDEIPTIRLNMEQFAQNLQKFVGGSMELQEHEISNALVALSAEAASLPTPKLKNINRLRTEHQVYELPDSHPLLHGFNRREPDDPSPYLLAIWTPGETADSIQPPESRCRSQETGGLCDDQTCFSCNSTREANSQIVRGTILVPCRTAMRGSFPLNGTYFQVNEVFADHDSSLFPVAVPRDWIWNLPRRTVFFGTSVPSIFKGLNTEEIQFCFWRGFVCVRGFEQCSRSPKPLMARLHFPASRMNNRGKAKVDEDN